MNPKEPQNPLWDAPNICIGQPGIPEPKNPKGAFTLENKIAPDDPQRTSTTTLGRPEHLRRLTWNLRAPKSSPRKRLQSLYPKTDLPFFQGEWKGTRSGALLDLRSHESYRIAPLMPAALLHHRMKHPKMCE